MKAFKTVNDLYVEPISFTVPRRAETFQADIFPPAIGAKPAVSADEWLQGKTGIPHKLDLESIYEGGAPKEVASDYKPPPKSEPVPAAAKPEPKEESKPAVAMRSPPPTMSEQKGSIAAMANKYQDNEEEDDEDDDETSSFEEISRPPQRAQAADPPKSAYVPKAQATPAAVVTSPPKTSPAIKSPVGASTPTQHSTPTSGGGNVEGSLDLIKQLIENQTKLISDQNDKIGLLVTEVETLKKKVGSSSSSGSQDQSERIRQLELELEEARS